MEHRLPERDRPWMMRTYAGHSTAKKSNELYRANLAKGQTGLSIAFDLPTQTGYDADHELARGEVPEVSEELVAGVDEVGMPDEVQPARRDEAVGAAAEAVAEIECAQPQRRARSLGERLGHGRRTLAARPVA